MNFIVTLIASWRRFLTAKPFFFYQFGMAVENRRHIFAATPFRKKLQVAGLSPCGPTKKPSANTSAFRFSTPHQEPASLPICEAIQLLRLSPTYEINF
jgi:hypothetical protein